MPTQATNTITTNSNERRILRRHDVESLVGFKRAYIYSLMKQGKFPKSRKVGIRAVGWDSREIQHWIEQQLK